MAKMRQIDAGSFAGLLAVHNPVPVRREHIEAAGAEKHGKKPIVDIEAHYPTIHKSPTSGLVLPSEVMPFPFRQRLRYVCMDMDGVYAEENGMLGEVIDNAIFHGSGCDKGKPIYLLWHKCRDWKEIYVTDEGRVPFDPAACLHKYNDDVSGMKLLNCYAEVYEYFDIADAGGKCGTLLRMIFGRRGLRESFSEPTADACGYIGHEIFRNAAGKK